VAGGATVRFRSQRARHRQDCRPDPRFRHRGCCWHLPITSSASHCHAISRPLHVSFANCCVALRRRSSPPVILNLNADILYAQFSSSPKSGLHGKHLQAKDTHTRHCSSARGYCATIPSTKTRAVRKSPRHVAVMRCDMRPRRAAMARRHHPSKHLEADNFRGTTKVDCVPKSIAAKGSKMLAGR
jgi:hypothetical protein